MNYLFVAASIIIGLSYIGLAIAPIWEQESVSASALRMAFLFCGVGHILHAHANIIRDHATFAIPWDVGTAVVSVWTLFVILRYRSHIFIARRD